MRPRNSFGPAEKTLSLDRGASDTGESTRSPIDLPLSRPMAGSESEPSAPEGLLAELYEELRALAAHRMRGERADHTLQPTALVHEAFLRMKGRAVMAVTSRTHFLAIASGAMRRVLVDHARARDAEKRGGGVTHVTVGTESAITEDRTENVLAVEAALEKLAIVDRKAERIVEMRFYAGMTEAEIADVLKVSERWVRKQWAFARAWLRRELQPDGL